MDSSGVGLAALAAVTLFALELVATTLAFAVALARTLGEVPHCVARAVTGSTV